MRTLEKILIDKKISCKSVWFMRQAGRYLPEFRKIRSQNQNFINLCLNSKLSTELTLQPINRYDLDSAIIFSDILLVPYALGQDVKFEKGIGPILENFKIDNFLSVKKESFNKSLSQVYEAISLTRKKLDKNKSLISFVGAPWTLLTYMLKINKDNNFNFEKIKEIKKIDIILDNLIKFLSFHIQNQIEAGADVVQIFDSWAGLLPSEGLEKFCFEQNLRLVTFCKNKKIPVICFPKGIKDNYIKFNNFVKPDGLNLDPEIDPKWAKDNLRGVALQGGLDPKILLGPEDKVFVEAKKYLDIFKDVPYIFNLGHGLVPETNPDLVKKLVKFYRSY